MKVITKVIIMSEEFDKDDMESTTVVGVKSDQGVVICADRQVSGMRITEADKLKQIHPKAVIGTSGSVTDIQTFVKNLRTKIKKYKLKRGHDIRVEPLFDSVREVINPGAGLTSPSYLCDIVMVGYEDEPLIAEMSFYGTKTHEQDFVVVGSGGSVARGVLSSQYEDDLSLQEAKELAIKSLRVAAKEGVYTGLGVDVATITEDGVEMENGIDIEYRGN